MLPSALPPVKSRLDVKEMRVPSPLIAGTSLLKPIRVCGVSDLSKAVRCCVVEKYLTVAVGVASSEVAVGHKSDALAIVTDYRDLDQSLGREGDLVDATSD